MNELRPVQAVFRGGSRHGETITVDLSRGDAMGTYYQKGKDGEEYALHCEGPNPELEYIFQLRPANWPSIFTGLRRTSNDQTHHQV